MLGAWTADTLGRNAQGKLTSVGTHGPAVGTAQLVLRYDGMGGLLTSELTWLSSDRVEEYRRDALGNVLWEGTVGEVTRRPPATFQYGSFNRLQRRDALPPTGPSTCQWAYPDSLKQTYDAMGNVATKVRVTWVGQGSNANCTAVQTGLEFEFHWYSADNKLRFVQREAGNPTRTVRTGTFEEYWYDPLGRRIRVRERRDTLANQLNLESAETSTIWDGDRLLYERRGQAAGESAGSLFRYGTVGYIHGRELDAPLAVRDGMRTRVPLPDWRGQYQGSVFPDGTPADCATGQSGQCTSLDWPAKAVAMTLRGWAGAGEEGIAYVWKGSLVSSNRDGTGMLYRRNRYYDPVTGRFTQVDPIGLAGGVNVYGFAEGDPVNIGDPFGLVADTAYVEGEELTALVRAERARNPAFYVAFTRLQKSTRVYAFISSEKKPRTGENDKDFTGFSTMNDPNDFPKPILSTEFQEYWREGTTAGIMIGINSPHRLQVIGHEMVHLLGMEEIGRPYSHNDPHQFWRIFPIPRLNLR